MFHQLLTPVGDNLALSFIVAALPIVVVLVALGVLRRPAWVARSSGLIVALAIADRDLAVPGPAGLQQHRGGRRVRAVAGDVDRVQRAAPL